MLLEGTLLCKKDMDKKTQASQEGDRVKRLMGALRYLYRNSFSASDGPFYPSIRFFFCGCP